MNFERMIAIGDIHGQIDLLKDLIENMIKPTNDDCLVFLGDYIDRAPNDQEMETLFYLKHLKENNPDNIILLRGNHEDMAWNALNQPQEYYKDCWISNGGTNWEEHKNTLINFINETSMYLETDNYIFVHAGATEWALKNINDKRAQSILLWERAGNQKRCFGKRLVVGHTPQHSVIIDDNRICVDTEAYKTGLLSAYDVFNEKIYCSYRKWKFDY